VTFTRPLTESYTGVEKETLTLECEVSKDNVRCVWKRYGKVVEDDERVRIESDGRVQRYIITNLTLADRQNLSCVAIRGRKVDEELATTNTKIAVNEGPLELVKGLEDLTVKEGQDALLQVTLNKPNEEVEWFKDGVKLKSDANHRLYSNNNVYILRVNNCDPKTSPGQFTFKIKEIETSGKLDVEEKPIEIIAELRDKVVVENQTVRFEIELNKPELDERLVWLKDGVEIDHKAQPELFELKSIGNKYMFTIKKAQFDDAGQYEVKIKDTPLSSAAKLRVEEAPLEFVRQLADVEVKEGQTATFECELNKADEPVRWFSNGTEIKPDGKRVIARCDGKVHTLTVKKCDAADAAKIACKTAGPSSNANLYVEGIYFCNFFLIFLTDLG
jgi:titin